MKPDLLDARGAFALGAFMQALALQGEGFDESTSKTIEYSDYEFHTTRHIFAAESYGQIELSSCIKNSARGWSGKVSFRVSRLLDTQVDVDAFGWARNQGSDILFVSNHNDLGLGGFFSRRSNLRTSLVGFLCGIQDSRLTAVEAGQGLLRVIQSYGLPALIAVWDDLLEAEIIPALVYEDPFGYPELDPVNPAP